MTETIKVKYEALIKFLTDECEGLSLIDADITLDDARRYLWLKQFTGASDEALKERLDGPHLTVAVRIAERLVGVITPLEAEQVFLEVRTGIWMAEFSAIPESLFAHQLQAYNERNRKGVVIQ